jgi:NADPH:quinone reductase-like Zn-dependent oxidoreductase
MRAVVIQETGGPEVLRLEHVPDPEPAEGEVLIRVEAAGVNHYDVNQRAGGAKSLPAVLGSDAAGRRVDTGERVLVSGGRGTYAELVAVPEDRIWPIPDGLDAPSAAAIGVPYRTAWWALVELAGLKAGDTLLVQAASSATGQASVDLGKALGATVFATASPGKVERVAALGVEAFPYDDPRVVEVGADVVFDPVGADTFSRSVEALGRGGRLVTPGAIGDSRVCFDVWSLVGKQASIIGIGSSPPDRDTISRLVELAAAGKLRPVIDRVLPLDQAAEAHRLIEDRQVFGKVILEP